MHEEGYAQAGKDRVYCKFDCETGALPDLLNNTSEGRTDAWVDSWNSQISHAMVVIGNFMSKS